MGDELPPEASDISKCMVRWWGFGSSSGSGAAGSVGMRRTTYFCSTEEGSRQTFREVLFRVAGTWMRNLLLIFSGMEIVKDSIRYSVSMKVSCIFVTSYACSSSVGDIGGGDAGGGDADGGMN